ncbi:MAG: hypothetical protein M3N47_08620 [Chloroflexota bacterium]|nr:hypothetical protein [Chloroflexota bacterium]
MAEYDNPFKSQGAQNPFKAQGAEPPPGETPGAGGTGTGTGGSGGAPTGIRPFRAAQSEAAGPQELPKKVLRQKVKDLGIGDPAVLARNQVVANLTVYDLRDLAARFEGAPVENKNIAQLTIEDLQDLEGVFLEYKLNTSRQISSMASSQGEVSAEWSVSCCSCTPCCSCAAAEVDPVRA